MPIAHCPLPTVKLLHHTTTYAVIEKPPGLLSVPGKGPDKQDCVPARLLKLLPHATGPLVVHRLDMDTSGLLVLGLTPEAQRTLSAQFEARVVHKRYIALVDGLIDHPALTRGESVTIDFPIRPDIDNRPWQIHDPVHGRNAVTHIKKLADEIDRTRLELTPITGRAHQLRVHCAFAPPLGLGHPILGDVLYGPTPKLPAGNAPRLMLHAAYLSFIDPDTNQRVEFHSTPEF